MFDYLIAREQDEMFRMDVRDIPFPDNQTRRIKTYRLIWRWYDRAMEYEFGPDNEWLLGLVLRCAEEESLSIDEAFGKVLEHTIRKDESDGMDYTDDNIELLVAQRAKDRFYSRKKQ
ncbi:MAG: hypothetical protein ABJN40_07410 [Sneathiella sp.]